jgi:large subunit ribosomal protein L1
MAKQGKKYREAAEAVEDRAYGLEEAIEVVKKVAYAKFDESVELAFLLGVDPRQADQLVRGTVVLPHGTGKTKRVLTFATGEKVKEAEEAGSDFVGGADLVKKIQDGWLEFDAVIATPDMMREVGKLGRVLGPKGLMPNPKTGTVTFEVAQAVREIKAGRVEFRVDKTAIIHNLIGRKSFETAQLLENAMTLSGAILRAKPTAAKGRYLRSATISSTMGPPVPLDIASLEALV